MTITNTQILKVLQVLSWIIFIALCIETGGLIFNTGYAMYKPIVAGHFWNGNDLSAVYGHNKKLFLTMAFLMTLVAGLKATIFWLIVKLFYDKKFTLDRPFSTEVTKVLMSIAGLCLAAGIFSILGSHHVTILQSNHISVPSAELLKLAGGDVWIFMAVVVYVISQVFKKGIQLQTEIDHTV